MSANRQHLQYYIASTIEHVTNQYYQSTFIYSLATYLLAATTGVQTSVSWSQSVSPGSRYLTTQTKQPCHWCTRCGIIFLKQHLTKRKFVQTVNVSGSVSQEHVDFNCALASVFSVGRESKQKSSSWLALNRDTATLLPSLKSATRCQQIHTTRHEQVLFFASSPPQPKLRQCNAGQYQIFTLTVSSKAGAKSSQNYINKWVS